MNDLRFGECSFTFQRHFIKLTLRSNIRWNGISVKFLLDLQNFLASRKQRVVLNGQQLSWKYVSKGIPQGSILEPIFFFIYINNLSEGL